MRIPHIPAASNVSRRFLLKTAGVAGVGWALPLAPLGHAEERGITSNGGANPYLIPWLDKNGSHNQRAGPNLEPSHIYHFLLAIRPAGDLEVRFRDHR